MAKAIHSMVRVLDESRSLDFYQKALGLSIVERLEFETFVLIYIANSSLSTMERSTWFLACWPRLLGKSDSTDNGSTALARARSPGLA